MERIVTLARKYPYQAISLAVIALFVFLRVWRLNLPGDTVFDEVYFPKMAWQYLTGETFFDIHPPLGKLIIAIGEIVFNNTTVGWRIMPLLAGIALLPATYWSVRQIFADKRAGLIAALLVAIDGIMIVYSRTGLMDIFMLLFGTLSLGFCWQFRVRRLAGETAWLPLLLTGFFAGLAVAIKWIGIGFLPLVGIVTLATMVASRKIPLTFKDFLIWLLIMTVLPAVVYTLPFLANMAVVPGSPWQTNFWHEFILWHKQSWGYNVNLSATHPYASKWWSWPFLIRPIWFYYKGDAGNVIGVDGIGNPLLWWGSTLAVVYTVMVLAYSLLVWRRKESQIITSEQFWSLSFIFAGWAAFYLPWTVVGRVLFLYHYLTSYLFALFLSAFWLAQAFQGKLSRIMVILLLVAIVAVSLVFAPIWIAYPIPQEWFNRLMWFKSWI